MPACFGVRPAVISARLAGESLKSASAAIVSSLRFVIRLCIFLDIVYFTRSETALIAAVGAMTDIIEISDLLNPVLTPLQRGVLEATARQTVDFSVNAVLDAARAETGLSDFGPPDFRDRLHVVAAGDRRGRRGLLGHPREPASDVRALRGDAAAAREFPRAHPQVREVAIDGPVIVAGLPRSGTTHLLNLLSADQRLRSLPWWEAIAPIPDPASAQPGQPDPRWTRAAGRLGTAGCDAAPTSRPCTNSPRSRQ